MKSIQSVESVQYMEQQMFVCQPSSVLNPKLAGGHALPNVKALFLVRSIYTHLLRCPYGP